MNDNGETDSIPVPEETVRAESENDSHGISHDSATADDNDLPFDTRLYLPDNDEWEVYIKRDSERLFCYSKHPGEDWFHLLLNGEIYVARQHEKYCLRCALRMGFLTHDRLFWQHRVPRKHKPAL